MRMSEAPELDGIGDTWETPMCLDVTEVTIADIVLN